MKNLFSLLLCKYIFVIFIISIITTPAVYAVKINNKDIKGKDALLSNINIHTLWYPYTVIKDAARNRYLIVNKNNYEDFPIAGSKKDVPLAANKGYVVTFKTSDLSSDTLPNLLLDDAGGAAIIEDTLYIATNHAIVCYNLNLNSVIKSIGLDTSQYNLYTDICYAGNRTLFLTGRVYNRIYKLNIDSNQVSVINTVGDSVINPFRLIFDNQNNRLIFTSYRINSPVQALNLSNMNVSTLLNTNYSLAGLAEGNNYYYFSNKYAFLIISC